MRVDTFDITLIFNDNGKRVYKGLSRTAAKLYKEYFSEDPYVAGIVCTIRPANPQGNCQSWLHVTA